MKPISLIEQKDWPNNGCDHNLWYTHFKEFSEILSGAKDETYWIEDMALKYLNLRVDTRNNRFVLLIDGRGGSVEKTCISPIRVIKAINKYRQEFNPEKELISEISQARN